MSKMKKIMAAALAMAAMASGSDMFAPYRVNVPSNPYEGETDEERKRRLHKMYGNHSREYEFIIKGERIMARDKKTAMKIYANRYSLAKIKKCKKKIK